MKLKSNQIRNWLSLGFMNESGIDKEKLYDAINKTFPKAKIM